VYFSLEQSSLVFRLELVLSKRENWLDVGWVGAVMEAMLVITLMKG